MDVIQKRKSIKTQEENQRKKVSTKSIGMKEMKTMHAFQGELILQNDKNQN